jgi:choline monooxygenase
MTKSERSFGDQDLFVDSAFALTRQPVQWASTMPNWCYTSPVWYEREIDRIFFREWLCVGRAEDIPKPGDYFTAEIVGEPLVIVRDQQGTIHAHSAVCRHRGTVVVNGSGNCKAFQCPYHNWTYALSGELVGTPGRSRPMRDVEDFDRSQYGLIGVRLEQWGGFLFVNFHADAPPLSRWLGDLPERVRNYGFENMTVTQRSVYWADCNWKVYVENANEGYHVATVHRSMDDPTRPRQWSFEEPRGPYEAQYVVNSISALGGLPEIDGLSEKERAGTYFIWVHPTLFLILAPTYLRYRLHFPEGPERVRLVEAWCFPRSTVESSAFADQVGPAYYERYAQINIEDVELAPQVQRGLQARLYRRGRYACPDETVVHRCVNYVIDRVVEPHAGEGNGGLRP